MKKNVASALALIMAMQVNVTVQAESNDNSIESAKISDGVIYEPVIQEEQVEDVTKEPVNQEEISGDELSGEPSKEKASGEEPSDELITEELEVTEKNSLKQEIEDIEDTSENEKQNVENVTKEITYTIDDLEDSKDNTEITLEKKNTASSLIGIDDIAISGSAISVEDSDYTIVNDDWLDKEPVESDISWNMPMLMSARSNTLNSDYSSGRQGNTNWELSGSLSDTGSGIEVSCRNILNESSTGDNNGTHSVIAIASVSGPGGINGTENRDEQDYNSQDIEATSSISKSCVYSDIWGVEMPLIYQNNNKSIGVTTSNWESDSFIVRGQYNKSLYLGYTGVKYSLNFYDGNTYLKTLVQYASDGDEITFNKSEFPTGYSNLKATVSASAAVNDYNTWHDINYTIGTSGAINVTNKSDQTISGSDTIYKSYGDSNFSLTSYSCSGGTLTYTVDPSSTSIIEKGSCNSEIIIKGVGTGYVNVSTSGDNNYNAASKRVSIIVSKGNNDINNVQDTYNKNYIDGNFSIGGSAKWGSLTYQVANSNICDVSTSGTVTPKAVGNTTITVTTPSSSNYNSVSKTINIYINNVANSITASNTISKTYGDNDFSLNASATAGSNSLTYSSSNISVATVNSSGTVHIVGGGTATIKVTSSKTGYNDATKDIILTVGKASQSINCNSTNYNKTYGDSSFNLGCSLTGGGSINYISSNNNVATVDASGNVTIKGAGSTVITSSTTGNSNYGSASKEITINVAKKSNNINTDTNITKSLADKQIQLSATATAGNLHFSTTDTDTISVTDSGLVTFKRTGTAEIKVHADGDANYNTLDEIITLNIERTAPVFYANRDDYTLTYGQSPVNIEYTLEGLDGIEAVPNTSLDNISFYPSDTNIVTVDDQGNLHTVSPGSTTVRVVFEGDSNYTSAEITVNVTVNKASNTITGTNEYNKKYGEPDFQLDINSLSGGERTYTSDKPDVVSVSSDGICHINKTGKATVTVVIGEDTNYLPSSYDININVDRGTPYINIGNVEVEYLSSKEISADTNSDGNISYTTNDTDIISLIDNGNGTATIEGLKFGTAVITITTSQTDLYNASSRTITADVIKIKPTNIYNPPEKITYGDELFKLDYSTNGGGKIVYLVEDTSVLSISEDGIVTINKAGTTKVTINVEESDNYLSSTEEIILTVLKKEPEISTNQSSYSTKVGSSQKIEYVIPNDLDSNKEFLGINKDKYVRFRVDNEDIAVISKGSDGSFYIKGKNAGITTGYLCLSESENYTAKEIPFEIVIEKADIGLTAKDVALSYYWDKDYNVLNGVNSKYVINDGFVLVSQEITGNGIWIDAPTYVTSDIEVADVPNEYGNSQKAECQQIQNELVVTSDTLNITPNGIITQSDVGTNIVHIQFNGNANYNPASTDIEVVITPAEITFDTSTTTKEVEYQSGISIELEDLIVNDKFKDVEFNKDYIVSYENNINVGKAIVNIIGIGNYEGSTGILTFAITPQTVIPVVNWEDKYTHAILTVEIPDNQNGKADVNITNSLYGTNSYEVDIVNGKGSIDVTDLEAGYYSVEVNALIDSENYKVVKGEPVEVVYQLNVDINNDGVPDINIDLNKDGVADINIDTNFDLTPNVNIDLNGNNKPDINIDTDGDMVADINIDLDNDLIANININLGVINNPEYQDSLTGLKPQINIDVDGDLVPDINIDLDKDFQPDVNINYGVIDNQNHKDLAPELNIDTDGDNMPDLNIDTDNDHKADINIDTNGDNIANINVTNNKVEKVEDIKNLTPHINIDTDNDLIPDINVDINNDLVPDINIDTDNDLKPDVNIDIDGDNQADLNISLSEPKTFEEMLGMKPQVNIDINGDKEPDINIDLNGDLRTDININKDALDGKADSLIGLKPQINIDTDGDFKPDINIDLNGDFVPDLNIDTDNDNVPNVNVDITGDNKPNINIDVNNDNIPDVNINRDVLNGSTNNIQGSQPEINIDLNGDSKPDLNIDINDDFVPDLNIDTDGDFKPELNIDTDNDGVPNINIDQNGDFIPDLNIDTDNDGIPNININKDVFNGEIKDIEDVFKEEPKVNIDTTGDELPNINVDTDGDFQPDLNIDINGDRIPDININKDVFNGEVLKEEIGNAKAELSIDTDNDGLPNINVDIDGDFIPDLNIDTDSDEIPDININKDVLNGKLSSNQDIQNSKPEINIDITGTGNPSINIDTDGDGVPDINIDTDGDNIPNVNINNEQLTNPSSDISSLKPGVNIDINNDFQPDININNDIRDGNVESLIDVVGKKPQVNIDINNDLKADLNIDTDGDGLPNININQTILKNPESVNNISELKLELNVDIDGDGKPDLNINDRVFNGEISDLFEIGNVNAETNIDTTGDGKADTNLINKPSKPNKVSAGGSSKPIGSSEGGTSTIDKEGNIGDTKSKTSSDDKLSINNTVSIVDANSNTANVEIKDNSINVVSENETDKVNVSLSGNVEVVALGIADNGERVYTKHSINNDGVELDTIKGINQYEFISTEDYTTIALQIDNPSIYVNNQVNTMDTKPIIVDDYTMVPIRFISEYLGAEVSWNGINKTVIIQRGNKKFTIKKGDDYSKNGVIRDSRMLVPLRFVAESLDVDVNWYSNNKEVTIIKSNLRNK